MRSGVLSRLLVILLSVVTAVAVTPTAAPAAPAGPSVSHTVTYDRYSLMVDGQRLMVWAGEFHYWRLPSPDLWRDVLQKMKAAGYNAATIYFDWGYHSSAQGVYDFSGVRDVDRLLSIAAEVGIYVIARPGPYINAETDGGGFPAWLNRMNVRERSTDPTYLKFADEWLSQIDPIIARHQVTNGTGTVLLDQIENEFYDGSAAGHAYIQHLEDKARADGITVPLTGNHNGTFETGPGSLDIDGWDSYPQGFNCGNPTRWNGAPDFSSVRTSLTSKPLYFSEFQGGAFDPWGGAGYANCHQLTGPDFEKVFYDTNIAVGSTMQNFYMTYGGTSWGYLPFPGVYTSYDYGAAIAEDRTLTDKYEQQKLTGYFLQAAPSLAKTDRMAISPPDDPNLWLQARANPDDQTELYVLRHANSTSTSNDTTHIAVDLAARTTYTYDDNDPALHYAGNGWTHATNQAGDFGATESWDNTPGDSMTVSFHGPAIRWIAPKDGNHGMTAVSVDGVPVATVDGYSPTKQYHMALYGVSGLADTDHTLTLTVTGAKNPAASGTFTTVDAVDVPPANADYYPTVPQQPGTAITLDGRDAMMLLANYSFGGQRMVYSTSQLMTRTSIDGRDVALLHGATGTDGETVLRYASQPTVTMLTGSVQSTWDAQRGDLRLNYQHTGLARVMISGGGRPDLELLLADDTTAEQFWQVGSVLVEGPALVRSATLTHDTLALTGDTTARTPVAVWAPRSACVITWNGQPIGIDCHHGPVNTMRIGTAPGPAPVTMPSLTWRSQAETPEANPAFDDSSWTIADHTTTQNPNGASNVPVLFADDYGYHHGDVWYRGHFTATGSETGISLTANTGNSTGQYSVWLNGTYLGTANGGQEFDFPAGTVHTGTDNVVSVLVANMGHDEGTGMATRGLTSARLVGSAVPLTWRIQGNLGAENPVDPVRGPLNNGGLFGERAGWSLPGYPDGSWAPATLPQQASTPGITWYRSTFDMHLPPGQDVPVALRFTDAATKHYRVQLYLNGWNLGQYVNDVGPQHDFQLPTGILRADGQNTLALAVWSDDSNSGLGSVQLVAQTNLRTSLNVSTVDSPNYDPAKYTQPVAPATVTLTAPSQVQRGATVTVTATVAVPADRQPVRDASVTVQPPSGWQVVGNPTVALGRLNEGQSATASWQVTAPTGDQPWAAVLEATATLNGQPVTAGQTVAVPPPPPSGTVFVSDLPFQATNGWGPVERDTSNGEQAPGDGKPITLNGVVYSKGLGTNAVSDISVYTGGRCTTFTAVVGGDAEASNNGSVTFSVAADGRVLTTTPVLRGGQPSMALNVNVTGAAQLDLVVGDGGDGNGLDHADWANAQLVCQ